MSLTQPSWVKKLLPAPICRNFLVGINLMQPLKPITRGDKRVVDQHFITTLFIAPYAYIQEVGG